MDHSIGCASRDGSADPLADLRTTRRHYDDHPVVGGDSEENKATQGYCGGYWWHFARYVVPNFMTLCPTTGF